MILHDVHLDHLTDYRIVLQLTKGNLIKLLKSQSTKQPIKYNLKLEAKYHLPHTDNSTENRAFETSTREIILDDHIKIIL